VSSESKYNPPRQTNYKTSLRMAREKLGGMDFGAQCEKAGVAVKDGGALIRFIGREFFVDRETLEVSPRDGGPGPEVWEKIVILHYLIAADGSPDSGELISYKQVPDGAPYYDVFVRRTSGILVSAFGSRLSDLAAAATKLGADTVSGHGDMAFKIRALPHVKYLFVLYNPDDEFPADVRIFFDSTLPLRLPAEDITVLCQMICLKLARTR